MEQIKTIQNIAEEMLENFTKSKKAYDPEIEYWHCKKTIEWQRDIIFKAHQDQMPNDYIYEFINDALWVISDNEGTEEDIRENIYDIEANCYTSNLTSWLNRNNQNVYYLTEAKESGITDGFNLLSHAQYLCKVEIANLVLDGIIEYIETLNQ